MMIFDFIISGPPAPRTDRHRLAGVVTVDGLPAARLVVVLDRETFELYAAKWSDEVTGNWEFYGLEEYQDRQLLVVALDNAGSHNAEVADYVSQVTA